MLLPTVLIALVLVTAPLLAHGAAAANGAPSGHASSLNPSVPGWPKPNGPGTPDPKVTVYKSGGVSASVNCGFGPACYKLGAIDTDWLASSKTSVQVDLAIPSHAALTNDCRTLGIAPGCVNYYVLLSIIDNHNSYDQIGFADSPYGWTATYSYSDDVCQYPNVHYQTHAFWEPLTAGNTYTFKMSLASGVLRFSVLQYGVTLWYVDVTTVATSFVEAGEFYCNPVLWIDDYTNYEEVFAIVDNQNAPPWSFFFTNNIINGAQFTAWGGYIRGNANAHLAAGWSGSSVSIYNEPWTIAMNPATLSVPIGTTSVSWGGTITKRWARDPCYDNCWVSPSLGQMPPGWSGSTGASGHPTFSFTVTLWIPVGTGLGRYGVEVKAIDYTDFNPYPWTVFQGYVSIYQPGGGGCVAKGTPILTPTGYVNIEKLKPGDLVVGYNLGSSSLVIEKLQWANATKEITLLTVNNGLLAVTPTDQPVFIQNSTFVGWLNNPQDLQIGDLLFNPTNGTWTPVTSIQMTYGKVTVYDVVTSGPNNFVANGVLLDRK